MVKGLYRAFDLTLLIVVTVVIVVVVLIRVFFFLTLSHTAATLLIPFLKQS